MSKQRAERRAVRQAHAAQAEAARQRVHVRRRRWRRLRARLAPPRGRTGKIFPRRNRAQRAGIAVAVLAALAFIWLEVDALSTRIALTGLVLVGSPALVVLTLDRRI